MDWKSYQQQFDRLDPILWLNHAGVSLTSTRVAQAIALHAAEVERTGALHVPDWYAGMKEVKQLAAGLMGAEWRDVALTPNTTHGVNLVANGLRWEPGDEILLSTVEYPANVYPWWAQQEKGAKLVWVSPDEKGRLPVSAYAEKITHKTRVLAVSQVQFASGYRHDLEALGKLCRQAGVFFFVDAIQSFSVFPLEVEAWGIDAMTTGSHKWLLGPVGIAMFYTSEKAREQISTTYVGADCMIDSLNYLDYQFRPWPDGRRFENAMLNFYGIAGLRAALELVHEVGRENIERRVVETADRLRSRLRDLGYGLHESEDPSERSGILSVTHPKANPVDLLKHLKGRNTIASVRDDRLRLSPHAYYTEDQIQRIEKELEEILHD